MTDVNVSRLGQINKAGSTDDLFLKVFPGEVMAAFDETNIMMPLHVVRTITSGKSAQFPALGKATASYHVPGTELTGHDAIKHAERVIFIDSILESSEYVADIDEAMNHYEIRGEYAKKMGEALAVTADKHLLQVAINTARSSPTVEGLPGGAALENASATTDANVLAGMIKNAAQNFDEKDVPESDRFVAFKPAQYYLLTEADKLLDRDFTSGNGDYASAKVYRAGDIEIKKSNHIPTTNIAAATPGVASGNTYHGNFSTTVGVAWHRTAFGTVKLMDVTTAKEYKLTRLATFMMAHYAMGHGVLRPECAAELRTAAPV